MTAPGNDSTGDARYWDLNHRQAAHHHRRVDGYLTRRRDAITARFNRRNRVAVAYAVLAAVALTVAIVDQVLR